MMGPVSLFAPTVDLHDVLLGWYPQNTNAFSAIHLEYLYQQKKKLSAPGDEHR